MVNLTDLEAKEGLSQNPLKNESNNDSIEMTEDDFKEFLTPYLRDIIFNDTTFRKEFGLVKISNFVDEDTEDLNDLEEIKNL
ncbi:MAG: hypothetical protein J1E99_04800 [Muribaculaceae bacterium]|nr:hypothetical protein [Muribaculaceae bacterium]